MYSISRKLGESIRFGDHLTITIVAASDDRVRLGVGAPTEPPEQVDQKEQKLSTKIDYDFYLSE